MKSSGEKFGKELAEIVKGYVDKRLAEKSDGDLDERIVSLARRVTDLEEQAKANKPRVRVPVGSDKT